MTLGKKDTNIYDSKFHTMALNIVPGASAITIPVSGVREIVGEETYQMGRKAATISSAIWNGLIPVNPATWPIRIGIMVALIIILLYAGMNIWQSFAGALVGQVIIVAILTYWVMDKFLNIGLGI